MIPKTHDVKSWTHFFQDIRAGRKTHDLRIDDREYAVGDYLDLEEWDNIRGIPTGERQTVQITYITGRATPCAFSSAALARGYVILSIKKI